MTWQILYGMDAFPVTKQQCQIAEGNPNTDPNQCLGLILSSSTTRLLYEGVLVPLH